MGIFDRPRQGHHTGRATIIIHVPVWAPGDRPVAFAGTLANRGSFLRISTLLSMAIQFMGTWFALLMAGAAISDRAFESTASAIH
jgi:hypothetical protein